MRSRQSDPVELDPRDAEIALLRACIAAALRLVDEGLRHGSAGPTMDRFLDIQLALSAGRRT